MQYGVGARLVGDFGQQPNGTQWHPFALVRYLHSTNDNGVTTTAAFAGVPDAGFNVSSMPGTRNHWQAGAGLSYDITPQASLYGYYSADIAPHSTSQAVNLGFRWSFGLPASAVAMQLSHRVNTLPAMPIAPVVLDPSMPGHGDSHNAGMAGAAGMGAAAAAGAGAAPGSEPFSQCKGHPAPSASKATTVASVHPHHARTHQGAGKAATAAVKPKPRSIAIKKIPVGELCDL